MSTQTSAVVEAALEASGYLATNEQLAALAQEYAIGLGAIGGVRVSYLRIMIAHAHREAGRRLKKLTPAQSRTLVQEVHDRLYAVVLTAITTPEIAPDEKLSPRENTRRSLERNRRSNFARTAKHAIDSFLDAGGKLWALKPASVTKEELRRIASPRDGDGAGRLVRSAERSSARVVRLVTQLAETNRPAARRLINDLIEKLGPLAPRQLTRRPIRRGELRLTPESAARASH